MAVGGVGTFRILRPLRQQHDEVGLRRLCFADKGATAAMLEDDALVLQLAVRPADGDGVDAQGFGELLMGGQLLAGLKLAGRDQSFQLFSDLLLHSNIAVATDFNGVFEPVGAGDCGFGLGHDVYATKKIALFQMYAMFFGDIL